jgi:NAD-dependent SIR2 family protein deacetylase
MNTQRLDSSELTRLSRQRWVVLTGAGVSLGSGIPTYRDDTGAWLRSTPIQHQEFLSSLEKRKRYWARSALGWPFVASAQPNPVHHTLAQLEQQGRVSGVITQNVDRLHQKAGQQKVIDLHGRIDRVRCLDCNRFEDRHRLQERLIAANPFLLSYTAELAPDGDAQLEDSITEKITPVNCVSCNGLLMPDVVFFGGTVPRDRVELAHKWLEESDGLLVLGSSLMVYSGYRFCKWIKAQNKPLVIVNRGITRADDLADLKLNQDCEAVLNSLLKFTA